MSSELSQEEFTPHAGAKVVNDSFPRSPRTGIQLPPNDPASPNQIAEDANDFEINEQNLSGLPSDVKFAVEGGDTNTPPGFEEAK